MTTHQIIEVLTCLEQAYINLKLADLKLEQLERLKLDIQNAAAIVGDLFTEYKNREHVKTALELRYPPVFAMQPPKNVS